MKAQAAVRPDSRRAQALARKEERDRQGWAKGQPLTANVLTPFGQQRELDSKRGEGRRERREAEAERRAGARKPVTTPARARQWKVGQRTKKTVPAHPPRGHTRRKRIARAQAERDRHREARREVMEVYWLVYRARGYTGPHPTATLTTPGIIDWSTMPVVGR